MSERFPFQTDEEVRREIQNAWDELANRKPRFRSAADYARNNDDFAPYFEQEEYPCSLF